MENYNTVEKQYSDSNEFCNYKVTLNDNTIIYVPLDEANTDYQAIQEWSAIDGNNIIDNGGGE
tara:strand:+ start:307 stop:495 length:189 start_codon:yes stop_codon:yes gene_type:complete